MTYRLLTTCLVLTLSMSFAPAWAQNNWERASRTELDDVTLDFSFQAGQQFEVDELFQQWGIALGHTTVADAQIKGQKINLLTRENKMTWAVFKKILQMNGIVVVEEQVGDQQLLIKAYMARNFANNSQVVSPVITDPNNLPKRSEIITAIIPIQHGAGSQIYQSMRGLITRDRNRAGAIFFVEGPDVMLITDFAPNVEYYQSIIKALDIRAPGQEIRIRNMEHAIPSEISQVLQQLFQGEDGLARPQNFRLAVNAQLAQPLFVPHDPTNKLIMRAYPYQFEEIERLINGLDVRIKEETGKFHVYKCQNGSAENLAEKLSELFSQRLTGRRGATTGTTGTTVRRQGLRAGGAVGGGGLNQGANQNIATRIVADNRLNALLIQAEEDDYQSIKRLLRQLDKKRRRVFIEAMVWEITSNDDLTIAAELAALARPHEGSIRPLAATSYGLSDVTITNNGIGRNVVNNLGQGITAILTKDAFDRVPVILNLLQGTSESKRITTPFAITDDNVQATFRVTDRQPFNTTTLNNVASQQNVQFVDAVTELTITPQVNSNDNLTLDLILTLSSFGARASIDLPPPTTSRQYSGNVTIPNGQYVVFGGLDSESYQVSESKVPFLGDIPYLGHLFKRWTRTETKTKVYIFIRPVVFFDENFRDDLEATRYLRKKAHVESEREEWLPPVIPDPTLPTGSIEDSVFELFGTGSADPFK